MKQHHFGGSLGECWLKLMLLVTWLWSREELPVMLLGSYLGRATSYAQVCVLLTLKGLVCHINFSDIKRLFF